jgi:hypothetical protein
LVLPMSLEQCPSPSQRRRLIGRRSTARLVTVMRRAVVVLAAALLTLSGTGVAGTIDSVRDGSSPAGGPGNTDPPSTILSSVPVLSTDLPAPDPHEGRPAAAVGASPNGLANPGSEGVSNGTVRMLLSPPPPKPQGDD